LMVVYALSGAFFSLGLYFNLLHKSDSYRVWTAYGVGLLFLGLGIGMENYGKNTHLSIWGFAISIIAGIGLLVSHFI